MSKNVDDILREIEKLPLQDRVLLVKKTLKSLEKAGGARDLKRAARELLEDYKTDKDLTAFTDLDMENFYEPR
jgi:hypothetical protein